MPCAAVFEALYMEMDCLPSAFISKLKSDETPEAFANTPLKSPPLKLPSAAFWNTNLSATFMPAVNSTALSDESPPRFAVKVEYGAMSVLKFSRTLKTW